jgi:Phosphopantetheine attachment site
MKMADSGDPAELIRARLVRIYRSLSPGGRPPRDGERGELDSLAFLEFIVAIEREFGIAVETRELDEANFATTASTAAYVQRKLGATAA